MNKKQSIFEQWFKNKYGVSWSFCKKEVLKILNKNKKTFIDEKVIKQIKNL
ncbi:MAG: hypothetical protein AABY22_29110 [Nanoarchaeota archaeon]